jgi:hypothetical protein
MWNQSLAQIWLCSLFPHFKSLLRLKWFELSGLAAYIAGSCLHMQLGVGLKIRP